MGEERYPFPGGCKVGHRPADEFVAAIGVAQEFGLAEFPDGASGLFCKRIYQFHALKLDEAVGHLRSMGE